MPNALDIIGQRFGRLVALKKAPSRNGSTYWLCQCDCGNQKEIKTGNLTRGATKSCGCICGTTGKIKEKYCLNCGKELHKGQYKYCSNACQQEYKRKEYIEKVANGEESGLKKSGNTTKISDSIRTYLFKNTIINVRNAVGEKLIQQLGNVLQKFIIRMVIEIITIQIIQNCYVLIAIL